MSKKKHGYKSIDGAVRRIRDEVLKSAAWGLTDEQRRKS